MKKKALIIVLILISYSLVYSQDSLYYTNKGKSLQALFISEYNIPGNIISTSFETFFFCSVWVEKGNIKYELFGLEEDVLKNSVLVFLYKNAKGWDKGRLSKTKVLIPFHIVSVYQNETIMTKEIKRNLQTSDLSDKYYVFSVVKKYDEVLCVDQDD